MIFPGNSLIQPSLPASRAEGLRRQIWNLRSPRGI